MIYWNKTDSHREILVSQLNSIENMEGPMDIIMITRPFDLYPIAPHFYIVKLGFTGVYIFSYLCS